MDERTDGHEDQYIHQLEQGIINEKKLLLKVGTADMVGVLTPKATPTLEVYKTGVAPYTPARHSVHIKKWFLSPFYILLQIYLIQIIQLKSNLNK